MPTAVRSHAKINLGLYLGAPRATGSTPSSPPTRRWKFMTSLQLRAASAETSIRLSSNDARVPATSAIRPGRWFPWLWRRWASEPRSTFISKSASRAGRAGSRIGQCGCRAGGAGERTGNQGQGSGIRSAPANGPRRQGRLRCAAFSDGRNGAGAGSRPGGFSAARYRAYMVRGGGSGGGCFHAAGLSRLGCAVRRGRFDPGGKCR